MPAQQQSRQPAEVTARGAARRQQLVDAGVAVLRRNGWAGLTARGVAEEARANPGLIHYHFGGLPALRREVATTAAEQLFAPVVAAMTSAPGWQEGLGRAVKGVAEGLNATESRLAGELVAASVRDEEVRQVLASALASARSSLVPWLAASGIDDRRAPALAALLVAALDGLALHALVDPALPLDGIGDLGDLLARPAAR